MQEVHAKNVKNLYETLALDSNVKSEKDINGIGIIPTKVVAKKSPSHDANDTTLEATINFIDECRRKHNELDKRRNSDDNSVASSKTLNNLESGEEDSMC